MSTANQNNGKKTSSTNNSTANTPSSTPITTVANSQTPVQSITPPNNAPKYGTLVPNRIFVGGIPANTTESELLQLFSNYGTVKAAKIIQDRAGVSKGYGFITFESEEEAKRLQREADNIVLRERKLNIAPAIKKQPFSRAFDASSPPTVSTGGPAQFYIPAGGVPFYQGGVTYYPQAPAPPGDPNTQQAPVYQPPPVYPTQSGPPQTATYPSIVYPAQPVYMPQQFPYQPVPYDYNFYPNGGPQYMVGNQGGPQPQGPPMQPPGSPPRPQCYTQQLPYNADPMYFNMPIYGSMEGPTMYQDSLDMANGGIAEDNYHYVEGTVAQDVEVSGPTPLNNNVTHENVTSHPSQPDTTRQSNTPVVSLLSLDQHQEKDFISMQSGRRRKSTGPPANTTHHTYAANGFIHTSSFTNNSCPNPAVLSNNFAISNSANSYPNNVHPMPPTNYNSPVSYIPAPNEYPYVPKYNSNSSKVLSNTTNGYDRSTWAKKRSRNNDKYSNDNSNSNNLRTESNSSASVVDENRNEEKNLRTTVNTPPPAPYSPIMHHGFVDKYYTSRNFHNSVKATRGSFSSFQNNRPYNATYNNSIVRISANKNTSSNKRYTNSPQNRSNTNKNQQEYCSSTENNVTDVKRPQTKNVDSSVTNINNNNNNNDDNVPVNVTSASPSINIDGSNPKNCSSIENNVNTTDSPVLPQQIPPSGPQHFAPPVRRPKRSVRRVHGSGEIGAGDAPLPPSDVTDACKKLDNLKL